MCGLITLRPEINSLKYNYYFKVTMKYSKGRTAPIFIVIGIVTTMTMITRRTQYRMQQKADIDLVVAVNIEELLLRQLRLHFNHPLIKTIRSSHSHQQFVQIHYQQPTT